MISMSTLNQKSQEEVFNVLLHDVLDSDESTNSNLSGKYSEHQLSLNSIGQRLSTAIDYIDPSKSNGLTNQAAAEKLRITGLNVLTPPPKVPLWKLFLLQFTNLLMVLLLITGGLCILMFVITNEWSNFYVGALLLIVVLITCYETFSQEAKSDSLMEKFRALAPDQTVVIREGELQSVDAKTVVLGDIVRLTAGDKIPADCRVICNESMKVKEEKVFFLSVSLTFSFFCY
jgi:sodium/potassium-transporting ATPase subunit alpha